MKKQTQFPKALTELETQMVRQTLRWARSGWFVAIALAFLFPALVLWTFAILDGEFLEPGLVSLPFVAGAAALLWLGMRGQPWGRIRTYHGRLRKKPFLFHLRGGNHQVKRWSLNDHSLAEFVHPVLRRHAMSGASCQFTYLEIPESLILFPYPMTLVLSIDGFSVAEQLEAKDLKHLDGNPAWLLSLLALVLLVATSLMILGDLLGELALLPCLGLGGVAIWRVWSHLRLGRKLKARFREHLVAKAEGSNPKN